MRAASFMSTPRQRWTQTFTSMRPEESDLATALAATGLRLNRYLTDDHSWFRAVLLAHA